jgi:hypothetical protein
VLAAWVIENVGGRRERVLRLALWRSLPVDASRLPNFFRGARLEAFVVLLGMAGTDRPDIIDDHAGAAGCVVGE